MSSPADPARVERLRRGSIVLSASCGGLALAASVAALAWSAYRAQGDPRWALMFRTYAWLWVPAIASAALHLAAAWSLARAGPGAVNVRNRALAACLAASVVGVFPAMCGALAMLAVAGGDPLILAALPLVLLIVPWIAVTDWAKAVRATSP